MRDPAAPAGERRRAFLLFTGGAFSVLLTLMHKIRRIAKWLPSLVALGIAFLVPGAA